MFKDPLTTIQTIIASIRQPVPEYMEFRGTDTILDRSLSRTPLPRCPEMCTEENKNPFFCYEDSYMGMASDYLDEKDYNRLMENLKKECFRRPMQFNRQHSFEDDFIEILVDVFFDTSEEDPPEDRIFTSVGIRLLQTVDARPYFEKTEFISQIWSDEQTEEAIDTLKKALKERIANIRKDFARYVDNMPGYGHASSYVVRFPSSLTLIEAL